MRVADALAEAAALETSGPVFSVVGRTDRHLLDALERSGVKCILARSDHGAVAMADGYARASGGLGVCVLDASLAESTGATALATAVRRRSRVLLLSTRDSDGGVVRAIGAELAWARSRDGQALAGALQGAFRSAHLGRVAVVAGLPSLTSQVDGDFRYVPAVSTLPRPQRPNGDLARVREAAEVLLSAQRPILIAGRGAVASQAAGEIASLAESTGALLATTFAAKDMFRGHPQAIGVAGGNATDAAKALFHHADCIVAIGAGLNTYTTQEGRLFPTATPVVHVDSDPKRIGDSLPITVAVVGDAKAIVEQLRQLVWARRSAGWDEYHVGWEDGPPQEHVLATDGLDPRAVVDTLDRVLPENRTLVLDGGHYRAFVVDGVHVPAPDAFIDCVDFGAISVSLALAIGAALGNRERRCIALMGDGGLAMTVQELDTVARYKIPMTIIVFNDGAYGGELRQLEVKGRPIESVLFSTPGFARLAEALGLPAARVERIETLRELLMSDQTPQSAPLFLDVAVSRSVRFRYHPVVEKMKRERDSAVG